MNQFEGPSNGSVATIVLLHGHLYQVYVVRKDVPHRELVVQEFASLFPLPRDDGMEREKVNKLTVVNLDAIQYFYTEPETMRKEFLSKVLDGGYE